MSNYTKEFKSGKQNDNWNIAIELIKNGSLVLDVGCGKGNFGEALISYKHCTVDGIELDESDAKIAAKKLRKITNSGIEEVISSSGKLEKYDHIVFLDVIEHIYNPAETLGELKKLLKKNGTIIFSIPNMSHLSVRLMMLEGKFEYGETGLLDNTHLHFYTDKEINRVFNEAGYQVKSLKGVKSIYPDELLASELKKIGINPPSKDLLKVLKARNSHIFQYIGDAKVSSSPTAIGLEREFSSPNPNGTITQHYEEKLKKQTAELKQVLDQKTHELDLMRNSRSWRIVRKISRLKPHGK